MEYSALLSVHVRHEIFFFVQDLSDNDVGSPAAFAVSHMAGCNSTLVSLGLRGT